MKERKRREKKALLKTTTVPIDDSGGQNHGKAVFLPDRDDILGPITGKEIRDRALGREIIPHTPIRIGTDGDWVPASRLRHLFDAHASEYVEHNDRPT